MRLHPVAELAVAVALGVFPVATGGAQEATGGPGAAQPEIVAPNAEGSVPGAPDEARAPADGATATVVVATPEPFQVLRRILIDPGHGGSDSGCVGVAGLAEKDLTLRTARRLVAALEPRTEWVGLTRDDDGYPTLEDRTYMANEADADVLVSVHYNCAENPRAEGIEVFFLHPDGTVPGEVVPGLEHLAESRVVVEYGVAGDLEAMIVEDLRRTGAAWEAATLADFVQAALVRATGGLDRGVRQARFRVLRGARMPAIVTELGFLTHPGEGKIVFTEDWQNGVVSGLVEGLANYDATHLDSN